MPALIPIRMFFVAESISRQYWYSFASDSGLLFDRCRIVDFCYNTSDEVITKITDWTTVAAESFV